MRNLKSYIFVFFITAIFLGITAKGVYGNPSKEEIVQKYSAPGQIFETSQERGRFALTKSIAEEKTFRLDNFTDFSLPDISYKDGHYYSVFPPGTSILLLPAYYLGKYFDHPLIFVYAFPVMVAILSSLFVFAIASFLKLSKTASLLGAIIFPLATVSWSYSTTIYAHTFSTFCVVAGFYFALRSKNCSAWNHLIVWFLYGLSILIDYPNAILMLPAVGYMIFSSFKKESLEIARKLKEIFSMKLAFLYTAIPFFLILAALGYYNQITLGSWFGLAHNYRVTEAVAGGVNYQFLLSKSLDLKFTENGLYTLLFSEGRGIVFFAPVLVLSVLGLESIYRKSSAIGNAMVLTVLFNLLVYASFYDPWGGWSFGPRYLIMSMPFLAILAGESYDRYKNRSLFVILFALLFLASFSIALLGALTTNLLPPFPEVGRQISFLSLTPLLEADQSSILFFNYIQRYLALTLKDYYLGIIGFAAVVFLPVFLHQLFLNVLRFFRKIKAPVLKIQRKEALNV